MPDLSTFTRKFTGTIGDLRRAHAYMALQAASAAKSSAQTHFSMLGGFIGLALGCAFALWAGAECLATLTAMFCGAGVGLSAGVLLHRGSARIAYERELEAHRVAVDDVMAQLAALPTYAPADVRAALWARYSYLVSTTPTPRVSLRWNSKAAGKGSTAQPATGPAPLPEALPVPDWQPARRVGTNERV